jgi:hypothetical protein
MRSVKKILNLGSGRINDDSLEKLWINIEHCSLFEFSSYNDFEIINIDNIFDESNKAIKELNCDEKDNIRNVKNYYYSDDVFEFLKKYPYRNINYVFACRFFEHIPYYRVGELMYLLYSVCSKNSFMNIIVPDFEKVFESVKLLDLKSSNFNLEMIKTHTEIFNEPHDPHQSIWTTKLTKYYIELENYWKIIDHEIKYTELDKRNWYFNINCKRN